MSRSSLFIAVFNPLTARIFTAFGQFIRGQCYTKKHRSRSSYVPTSVSKSIKRSNFHDEITSLAIKGLNGVSFMTSLMTSFMTIKIKNVKETACPRSQLDFYSKICASFEE